ncbi:MAG: histone deacetylase family protein [Acidilobaceae archaeon]|nr:histone deacetylase family protein [Acidilobaceae archaeon]MCX8165313.1 histone deacetylase family protein [Acidilobaceae archaeon]MDW7973739.1 histone deacetylase family protein [Sulfolobales archaeon]
MKLHIVYDEIHRLHADPSGRHPSDPWRLERALSALKASRVWELAELHRAPAPSDEALLLAHEPEYLRMLEEESRHGFHYIDRDTYITEHSLTAGKAFASATLQAVQSSLESREPWFVMPRPGGHHAGRKGWAMGAPTLGFCLVNYAGIAAKAFLRRGLRVLALDFDAHHGNGTQDILWQDARAVHIDIHEDGIYPGSGEVGDWGGEGAEGTKVNVPLPPFSGDREMRWAVRNVVEPIIEAFRPEAFVISAGFDAFVGDPLTHMRATESSFELFGELLRPFVGSRPLVIVLEGGYGQGLQKGLAAFFESLMGLREGGEGEEREPPHGRDVRELLARFWGIG